MNQFLKIGCSGLVASCQFYRLVATGQQVARNLSIRLQETCQLGCKKLVN